MSPSNKETRLLTRRAAHNLVAFGSTYPFFVEEMLDEGWEANDIYEFLEAYAQEIKREETKLRKWLEEEESTLS